uniref:Uncharacterized protein n=1 Tax=Tetradesmus obliquus TaxID=3088 RepID=A0A383VYT5_TETOB|eukprot:jgi/Sobl393_1/13448/SZX69992.1
MASIHDAVYEGRLSLVQQLLDSGTSVEAVDDGGRTPLHEAATGGRATVVELLGEARQSTQQQKQQNGDKVSHRSIVQLCMAMLK